MPTPAEAALWQALRAHKLRGFKFRRQQVIGPFIVDFYCASTRLVVEVDGPVHERRSDEDAARQEFLEARGLHVLRFQNADVLDRLDSVLL